MEINKEFGRWCDSKSVTRLCDSKSVTRLDDLAYQYLINFNLKRIKKEYNLILLVKQK